MLFTAPTAFRAVRKEDPEADQLSCYDVSSLKRIFLAGERLDPPTYEWLKEHTGCQSLITGGRPKPAGPFAATRSALK